MTGTDDPRAVRVTYVVSRWGEPTQTFVRREAEALHGLGHRVDALSLKPPGPAGSPVPGRFSPPPATVRGVLRALTRRPREAAAIVTTVVRNSAPRNVTRQFLAAATGIGWYGNGLVAADLLHAHFGWVAATAAWAAGRMANVPHSVVLHAFEIHTSAKVDRFTPIPLTAAHQVFTISDHDASVVRDRWGVPARVMRMSAPARPQTAQRPTVARDRRSVVSVGSLAAKKGHADLIRALAELPAEWHLTIAGEGPQRRELEALVARLGLESRVDLLGHVDEERVLELLRSCGVFALASVATPSGDRDGIPVALMEAMACGAPVVTTSIGGIPELVDGCGTIVDSNDPTTIARAIVALDDDGLWTARATAGRQRVEQAFVPAQAVRPLVELLESMTPTRRAVDVG